MDLTKGTESDTSKEADTSSDDKQNEETTAFSIDDGVASYFANMPKHIYKIGQKRLY